MNHERRTTNAEIEFQKIVDRLKIDTEPNPMHREKLRRQMLNVFTETGRGHATEVGGLRQKLSRLISFPVVRLTVAAAAVIMVGVFVSVYMFGGGGVQASLAQVKQAVEKMPWMRVVAKDYHDGQETVDEHWLNFASEKSFAVYPGEAIWCWDCGPAQREFLYRPSTGTLSVSDLPAGGLYGTSVAHNFIDKFVEYVGEKGGRVNVYHNRLGDREVTVYEMEESRVDDGMRRYGVVVGKIRYRIVVDRETNLMLAGRAEYLDGNGDVISHTELEVSYPQTGPRDIYDLGVPRTAKVIDKTREPIGTPGNEPTPIPTPPPQ